MLIVFKVNGKEQRLNVSPDTLLLWVLREKLVLTGTKFGCGEGLDDPGILIDMNTPEDYLRLCGKAVLP